jgi:hypothetical protein
MKLFIETTGYSTLTVPPLLESHSDKVPDLIDGTAVDGGVVATSRKSLNISRREEQGRTVCLSPKLYLTTWSDILEWVGVSVCVWFMKLIIKNLIWLFARTCISLMTWIVCTSKLLCISSGYSKAGRVELEMLSITNITNEYVHKS